MGCGDMFTFNHKGKVLVSRFYRDDLGRNAPHPEQADSLIINITFATSFQHLAPGANIWLTAVNKQNRNPTLARTVRKTPRYELLDEMLDFGSTNNLEKQAVQIFSQVTRQIGWCWEGIKYCRKSSSLMFWKSVNHLMCLQGNYDSKHGNSFMPPDGELKAHDISQYQGYHPSFLCDPIRSGTHQAGGQGGIKSNFKPSLMVQIIEVTDDPNPTEQKKGCR
ncbi:AP-2 complex subunit mu [Galemys pyrenaicus]|uniref:AP-2 complex subunit mu n=1 Tax=Galemys pyrenaicus TaxID=202257 RepID=A0A8J6A1W2_GALPY|nr:AP-2 complex subunit mu [Galemys pyrenaicus]